MARKVNTEALIPEIRQLCMKACFELDENVTNAFRSALEKEESPYSKETLQLLIDNAVLAKREQVACCHDTGSCVVLLESSRAAYFCRACLPLLIIPISQLKGDLQSRRLQCHRQTRPLS